MTTKERILHESLKLFSTNGFDSVSTRTIARASNISDTAMYKHFENKQEILDTIIQICTERFLAKRSEINLQNIQWDDIENICMDMFRFQIEDEWITQFRQLLVIEQFKNPEISKLYQSFFIDIALNCMTEMFNELIKQGYMKPGNPKVYAMELYAPFFMYHTFRPDSEEILENLRQHITNFRNNVKYIELT